MSFQQTQQAEPQNPAPRHGGGAAAGRLYFVTGEDYSGFRAYYFVLASPLRIPQFNKVLKSGQTFDLEQYGRIVASGYGEPPESVKERMRTKYGWKG